MRVFGLTGGIASGKTQVAEQFRKRIPVIDADVLAREVVLPGQPALLEIHREFGDGVLSADGTLNRRALGAQVFTDPAARRKLNAIVHPRVGEKLKERLTELEGEGEQFACYEVPLLFESRLQERFRPIVLVATDPALQRQRIIARDGLTQADADARIASQMPLAEKRKLADYVIDNNGSLEECLKQADRVLSKVLSQLKAG